MAGYVLSETAGVRGFPDLMTEAQAGFRSWVKEPA